MSNSVHYTTPVPTTTDSFTFTHYYRMFGCLSLGSSLRIYIIINTTPLMFFCWVISRSLFGLLLEQRRCQLFKADLDTIVRHPVGSRPLTDLGLCEVTAVAAQDVIPIVRFVVDIGTEWQCLVDHVDCTYNVTLCLAFLVVEIALVDMVPLLGAHRERTVDLKRFNVGEDTQKRLNKGMCMSV